MAPGPSVAEHTPALPVSRPYTSAMNEAPCSCRVSTYSMDDFDTASVKRMFSSPGMPKTWVTPSFSRHSTISSAVVRLDSPMLASLVPGARCYGREANREVVLIPAERGEILDGGNLAGTELQPHH